MRPASAVQRGMWLVSSLDGGGTAFTIATATLLRGDLDTAALRDALGAVVARHEILRTRFVRAEGRELAAVTDQDCPIPVESATAAGLDEARAVLDRAAAVPFDLGRGPLLRLQLVRLGPREHVAGLTLHHAVADGRSVALLLTEWAREYAARTGGPPACLPPPPCYWDHVVTSAETGYWRERLRGVRPLDLPPPLGHDRPGADGVEHFAIGPELLAGVDRLARDSGATRYVVLMAAFHALLGRLCRTGDVAVGTTMATCESEEAAQALGPMFNTVVVRHRMGGDRSFLDVVAGVREAVLQAFEHLHVPFEDVLGEMRAGTAVSGRNPLFNTFFEVDHEEAAPLRLPGLAAEHLAVGHHTAKTDLMMALKPRGARLDGTLTYRAGACDTRLAATVAACYTALLREVTADPGRPLAALAMMPAHDHTEVTARLPLGLEAEPAGLCVHELFERQAARTPGAIAVRMLRSGAPGLTYAELGARADRLAGRLRALGVGPGRRVAVLLPRTPDLLVAFLAVWKAGGAYVPLDPAFPAARLRFLADDSRALAVVTEPGLLSLAGELGPPPVLVDGLAPEAEAPPCPVSPEDLCYVIYTSGSTGTPKGVLVEHRGLANFLDWCVRRYAATGEGGAPLFSSVAFDMVVPNLFTPLLIGQTVHIVPEEVGHDRLGEVLASAAPYSFVKLTPGHLQLLSRSLPAPAARGLAELLVVGADTFPLSVLREWRELDPATPILNEYGPTEASVANCVHEVGDERGAPPIGRPIPGTSMYVLGPGGAPMPVGVPGELYIGGACVARGYAGRPATTAAAFVPDPFGPPGSRLYRTGDLGRWLPTGELEFLGRADQQVKLQGYRIEPGEIESALIAHPSVRQALVTVAPAPSGQDALIAYVVPAGPGADTAALRERLAATLPAYLVPAAFVELPALPLNDNGKVDRAALPAPAWGSGGTSGAAYASDVESAVAEAWSEVLGVPADRLGRDDNFFALGGNSLLVLSVSERLRRRLGEAVSFESFLRRPTIAGVAAAISRAPGRASCLARLEEGGSGTPIVFVHPLGGTLFCYRHLLGELRGTSPLYGITLPSLVAGARPEPSLEEQAAGYAAQIMAAIDGPVIVAGWSAGGIIAFELARRLREEGGQVARLVLIDPSEPDGGSRWRGHVRELRQIRSRLALAGEAEREARFQSVVRSDLFAAMGVDPATCRDHQLFPQDALAVWERQLGLLGAYEPAPYDGEVALLTQEGGGDRIAPWRDLTGGIRHLRVEGDHLGMMRPPAVTSLAQAIRELAEEEAV
ncbi:hypothetical protein Aph01nite_59650 [Acrocarpospora phusangensis]|uniref:Carrier domain-containing protein n=1 Tax=Acrocarpospora phusangensis TaxID=1070424 RepID=A0A919QJU8_9ACTN|nr:non-ribosomal peptide synthetase [Acrocarpospora phusangensis]GIH27655.1 hypothetical protein Aph01nite_59650 [Acrocarpospora phusangensis]